MNLVCVWGGGGSAFKYKEKNLEILYIHHICVHEVLKLFFAWILVIYASYCSVRNLILRPHEYKMGLSPLLIIYCFDAGHFQPPVLAF
jgi:hypothetical protein